MPYFLKTASRRKISKMDCYIHDVPGRLRVKIPMIKCRKHRCERVQGLLADVEGIDRIAVNTITGSVLVHYDPDATSSGEILGRLDKSGYLDKAAAQSKRVPRRRTSGKAGDAVSRAFFGWAVGKALEGSGFSFLAALI
jgi:hypothetical protein